MIPVGGDNRRSLDLMTCLCCQVAPCPGQHHCRPQKRRFYIDRPAVILADLPATRHRITAPNIE